MMKSPSKQGLYDPAHEHDACGVGFVADIQGRKSNKLVRDALQVLKNLGHRGACGCEENTGDGAGVMIQLPDAFLRSCIDGLGFTLPPVGHYGCGIIFLPPEPGERAACEKIFEEAIRSNGQRLLGWRTVPTNNSGLGETARLSQPLMRMVFVGRGDDVWTTTPSSEAVPGPPGGRLAGPQDRPAPQGPLLRQQPLVEDHGLQGDADRRSAGQLLPRSVRPDMASALAIVHSRFSTNTFPSWARAHPYRTIAHNGEINTLRGNVNWMGARESVLESPLFGHDIVKVRPVVNETGSDSAMFDNVLELLVLGGRSLPHAVMMMVPEPWTHHESMSPEKKAFYRYHSCLMEPWDGPAAICFTDGVQIGTVLDRNGLRPLRYYVTNGRPGGDGLEAGVLPDIPADRVVKKGRIQPGRMFLIDTAEKRIISDDEIKSKIAAEQPYAEWVAQQLRNLTTSRPGARRSSPTTPPSRPARRPSGTPARTSSSWCCRWRRPGVEAMGSMGTDTPIAVLSERPQTLYNYFQQLFAQVTNPPVDAIREEIIMAAETSIGPERNLFDPRPESAHQIELSRRCCPTTSWRRCARWTVARLARLQVDHPAHALPGPGWRARPGEGAGRAVREGRRGGAGRLRDHHPVRPQPRARAGPIPALLACAAVHHHLLRQGTRTRTCLVIESGEPREVHHFCLLIGYGASAINPYLAFESLSDMAKSGLLKIDADKAKKNFTKAVNKGVVKVISKMGISTVQSYHGAQVFEAIGLSRRSSTVLRRHLVAGGGHRPRRHRRGGAPAPRALAPEPAGGAPGPGAGRAVPVPQRRRVPPVQPRDHPQAAGRLPHRQLRDLQAVRAPGERPVQAGGHPARPDGAEVGRPPVRLDQVESVDSIVKRFKTGAMSYGSISKEAHETLAIAMNRLGGKSNTGEGGEDPLRYVREPTATRRTAPSSRWPRAASASPATTWSTPRSCRSRWPRGPSRARAGSCRAPRSIPGSPRSGTRPRAWGLISPPPHHDIYSIEDLAQLIHDLKCSNDRARVSVKLVAEVGVGTVAAGVAKAKADVVLISGHDGGTGASPLTSIKHAGIPWELGLAETHQVLLLNNLRSRITVETDGSSRPAATSSSARCWARRSSASPRRLWWRSAAS
jgi:glutamate synthase (ferredoxin)